MRAFEVVIVLGLIARSLGAPTFPETTDTDDCPISESIKSFPHPTNCSKYYQCENGTKVEMNCTYNFHYNPKLKVCDFPRYAGCRVNESSTHLPLNDTETKNETRILIGKEDLKPKFDQKISEHNSTLGENGTGFVRNGNTSLERNISETNRNENITFKGIFGYSKLRNSSFNSTAVSNTTGSAANSSLLANKTLEKIIPFSNNSQSSHEPNEVTSSQRNATTLINKEEATEDSSDGITGSSAGRTTIQPVNVTNGKEIKIADKREEEVDDSGDKDNKDDESEEEEEEDKKENDKP